MILKTERLILRPWEDSDAENLYKYAKDPEVGPIAGWPPHESVEGSLYAIRHFLNGPECYAICLKDDGTAIGSVELKLNGHTDMTERDDECELGYWLGKPFWGRGIMPEAVRELLHHGFSDLKMRTVWCGYYEGNVKSKRVQEKCGFVYHHYSTDLPVPALGEIRNGYVSVLTKEKWLEGLSADFVRERIPIGEGATAKVYRYKGQAYKVYNGNIPDEVIAYELRIQQEIAGSGLPVVRYFETEFPKTIGMELIDGVSWMELYAKEPSERLFEDFMEWFIRIHEVKGLNLPRLSDQMSDEIDRAPVDPAVKEKAERFIEETETAFGGPEVLCHLDYHPLNIMYDSSGMKIIDWVNAKNAKAVWDYARTYVIFYEFAAGMEEVLKEQVLSHENCTEAEFMKAVYVMAVVRLNEHDAERIHELIEKAETAAF